jgi:hypothetical protein
VREMVMAHPNCGRGLARELRAIGVPRRRAIAKTYHRRRREAPPAQEWIELPG